MLHKVSRRAAVARAKAASRLAEATNDAYVTRLAIDRWDEAYALHGGTPVILRGLANALLTHSEVTWEADTAHRALTILDRLDANDPRTEFLRGLTYAFIGEAEKDPARLRDALALFVRVRRTPHLVHQMVAGALAAEVAASEGLAEITRDPRDARRAREKRDALRDFAPGMVEAAVQDAP